MPRPPRKKTAATWDDQDFPPPGPEAIHAPVELRQAVAAAGAGQPVHAACHLASALAADPREARALTLLEALIAAERDPATLFPLDGEQPSFALRAGRAYVDARQGRLAAALDTLYRVLAVRPEVDYHAWAGTWLEAEGAAASIDPGTVAPALHDWVVSFGGLTVSDPDRRALLERGLPVIDRLTAAHPGSDLMLLTRSVLLRKLGRLDEALAGAVRAVALRPTRPALVAEAMARRALGEVDGAVATFRRVLLIEPENLPVRLDIGDLLLDAVRPADALAAYDEVLERDDRHPWAFPSALYCRFLVEGSRRSLQQLRRLARTEPEPARACELLHQAEQARPAVPTVRPRAQRAPRAPKTPRSSR
jgi:tetratricopeptide (TPR) repeat protein